MLKAPRASQVALVVKNLPANAADVRDMGSIPGSGWSPGEGNGDPLQYSCLENSKDRGTWQATVHRAVKSRTRLKWLSTQGSQVGRAELGLGPISLPYLCCLASQPWAMISCRTPSLWPVRTLFLTIILFLAGGASHSSSQAFLVPKVKVCPWLHRKTS